MSGWKEWPPTAKSAVVSSVVGGLFLLAAAYIQRGNSEIDKKSIREIVEACQKQGCDALSIQTSEAGYARLQKILPPDKFEVTPDQRQTVGKDPMFDVQIRMKQP